MRANDREKERNGESTTNRETVNAERSKAFSKYTRGKVPSREIVPNGKGNFNSDCERIPPSFTSNERNLTERKETKIV